MPRPRAALSPNVPGRHLEGCVRAVPSVSASPPPHPAPSSLFLIVLLAAGLAGPDIARAEPPPELPRAAAASADAAVREAGAASGSPVAPGPGKGVAAPGSDQAAAAGAEEVVAALVGVDPLAVTPEMRAFADGRVGRDNQRQVRLMRLRDSIFDADDGLGVTYGSSATHTAAGTFEERSGNCLSFTLLFVSLARYLGLEAHFVEVDEVTGWSQRGGVSLAHWHMYAEVELDNDFVQVDFLPWSERQYRAPRRIGEDRARAHYFNNMGVDAITRGRIHDSVAYFERSLELDATFAPASINLAVAQRRAGRPRAAEGLLLEVLDSDPDNIQAASNLANLYISLGEHSEAGAWKERREELRRKNPYHHFRLGLEALSAEQGGAARDHFRRAISRQADEPIFHEKLAEAFFLLGEMRKVRRSLGRASELTEDPAKRRQLEKRLEGLEAYLDPDG